jgi:hypothetical protein
MIAALPSSARAAGRREADWPCVQPNVPQMSVAAIWNGPSIADVGSAWQDDPAIKDIAVRLGRIIVLCFDDYRRAVNHSRQQAVVLELPSKGAKIILPC